MTFGSNFKKSSFALPFTLILISDFIVAAFLFQK